MTRQTRRVRRWHTGAGGISRSATSSHVSVVTTSFRHARHRIIASFLRKSKSFACQQAIWWGSRADTPSNSHLGNYHVLQLELVRYEQLVHQLDIDRQTLQAPDGGIDIQPHVLEGGSCLLPFGCVGNREACTPHATIFRTNENACHAKRMFCVPSTRPEKNLFEFQSMCMLRVVPPCNLP